MSLFAIWRTIGLLLRPEASLRITAGLVSPVAFQAQFFFEHSINGTARAHVLNGATEAGKQPFRSLYLHGQNIPYKDYVLAMA